jgi:opacity protein-like surface antigen
MGKKITLIGLVLLFAFTAAAQDTTPQMEAFLGYTFTRMNSATNVPAFRANGGSGQFVYDFNKWISAVADLGAVHNGNIHNIHLDTTMANFLVGPRVPVRRWSRVTPYFQILFGEVYASTSAAVPADLILPSGVVIPTGSFLRATKSESGFGMTVGGGLDIQIAKHVNFRPIQLEYFLTRLQNLRSGNDNNQSNLRYSAGFNFTFGESQ